MKRALKSEREKYAKSKGWITPENWIMTKCIHCGAWTVRRTKCHICEQNPLTIDN